MTVTQNFKDMALSFSGCDGGNLNSNIWTCGLEWGGGYENNIIPEDIFKALPLGAWDIGENTIVDNLNYQYNQKLAWFFSYLLGWDAEDYKNESVTNGLYCKNGIGFKMNAFPISFPDRDSVTWLPKTIDQTGFNNFSEYKNWCVEHRGAYFHDLIKIHSPKLVLCTGIESSTEFMDFFRCDESSIKPQDGFNIGLTNNAKTLITVVPFFGGPNGINSYEKMETLTGQIDAYAKDHFGSKKWNQQ